MSNSRQRLGKRDDGPKDGREWGARARTMGDHLDARVLIQARSARPLLLRCLQSSITECYHYLPCLAVVALSGCTLGEGEHRRRIPWIGRRICHPWMRPGVPSPGVHPGVYIQYTPQW